MFVGPGALLAEQHKLLRQEHRDEYLLYGRFIAERRQLDLGWAIDERVAQFQQERLARRAAGQRHEELVAVPARSKGPAGR